jgi:hypothetical protein
LSLSTFAAKIAEYKKMKNDARMPRMMATIPGGGPIGSPKIDVDPKVEKLALAMLITWIVIFLICLITWIWNLVVLTKYWDDLPVGARVFGIIAVFTVLSPISLIVIYATKGSQKVLHGDSHEREVSTRLSSRSRHH